MIYVPKKIVFHLTSDYKIMHPSKPEIKKRIQNKVMVAHVEGISSYMLHHLR